MDIRWFSVVILIFIYLKYVERFSVFICNVCIFWCDMSAQIFLTIYIKLFLLLLVSFKRLYISRKLLSEVCLLISWILIMISPINLFFYSYDLHTWGSSEEIFPCSNIFTSFFFIIFNFQVLHLGVWFVLTCVSVCVCECAHVWVNAWWLLFSIWIYSWIYRIVQTTFISWLVLTLVET